MVGATLATVVAAVALSGPAAGADWRLVTGTAYCSCPRCCGPSACGLTASGTRPVPGRTLAANWLPFGTQVRLEGLGVYRVEDRMSRRFPSMVDVFMADHLSAVRFGKQQLRLSVIGPAPKERTRNATKKGR